MSSRLSVQGYYGWVVERTHRWMTRFRRILIRWDKKVCNDLGLLHLACAYMTYKQSGLLG
jgi:putative transposase